MTQVHMNVCTASAWSGPVSGTTSRCSDVSSAFKSNVRNHQLLNVREWLTNVNAEVR